MIHFSYNAEESSLNIQGNQFLCNSRVINKILQFKNLDFTSVNKSWNILAKNEILSIYFFIFT